MSDTQTKLKNRRSWLTFLAAGFLIISLVFIAITFFLLANDTNNEQQWTSLSTDVQVTSQQLANFAGEAAFGKLDAFIRLEKSHEKIVSAIAKLRSGSTAGELPPTPPEVDVQMKQLSQAWGRMSANASLILDYRNQALQSNLPKVRGVAEDMFLDSRDVFNRAASLKLAIAELSQTRLWPSLSTGIVGLAAMIAVVWLLIYQFLTQERRRALIAARSHKNTEQAISTLREEMKPLAEGDLTVHASATEDITRAIAESVNIAIAQLRELVRSISHTSREVASVTAQTRGSASELAKSVALQANQVGQAKETVQKMALSFDAMAKRSLKSSEVARNPENIAHSGGENIRETINGMDMVQDQIQQTANRIKRLGESTQEVRDIVVMINGFAEQTNMLALNAAIQAASTGGAGKGFAVVADEVQQLAEGTTDATGRIETLVQTIQTDAHEAVVSLESTTSEMVSGTSFAEDAGTSLEQIEMVSRDLFNLISGIAEEANTQSSAAMDISELMKSVQEVSVLASEGSTRVASSVEEVAGLVMQLSDSVTDFKLPEDN